MCVVAGKWCHYDAGISEFCLTFHLPEKVNRPGIPLFFFFFKDSNNPTEFSAHVLRCEHFFFAISPHFLGKKGIEKAFLWLGRTL